MPQLPEGRIGAGQENRARTPARIAQVIGRFAVAVTFLASFHSPARAFSLKSERLQPAIADLRQDCAQHRHGRGASPKMEIIKQRLIEWIEANLAALPPENDALIEAELAGGDGSCGDELIVGDDLGSVTVSVRRNGPFYEVRTAVGIHCGSDQSAYLYRSDGDTWLQVWKSEQQFRSPQEYRPQRIVKVLISPTNDNASGAHLVMTLGVEERCTSNWHTVYYRLWRIGAEGSQTPILDEGELAWVPDLVGTVHLSASAASVELVVPGDDEMGLFRNVSRQYEIDGSIVRRVR